MRNDNPQTTKKLTIEDCDDEFGEKTVYWLSQMAIYVEAGKSLDDIVNRMISWGERHE